MTQHATLAPPHRSPAAAPPARLRVAIADDEAEMRDYLREVLPRLGHQVVAEAATGRELVEGCRTTTPDLVITDIRMSDVDGIDAAALVNQQKPTPVVLVSAHHDADLLGRASEDYIMGYLVKPVKEADLKTAIAIAILRYQHYRAVAQEAATVRQALEDRKVIERAKGAIMRRLRVDEEDAFCRLRKMASDQNRKLVDMSRDIMGAEEVFRHLERT